MEKVRVLHVLQRMEPAGIQTLLMSIYKNIDREKVQFDFLVHYKTPQFFDDEIEKMGGKVYRLSVREDFNFFKYLRDLNHFFKNHKEYKIVHGHMNVLGFIYLHYAKKYKVPVRVAHSHTNNTEKKGFKKFIVLTMNKLFSKSATDLFACSKDAGKFMFGNKNFTVINNAIDSKKFSFDKSKRDKIRKDLNLENNFVVGHAGRFYHQKNHNFIVDIFEQLKKKNANSKLVLIGNGPLEDEIKSKVKKLKLENDVIYLKNRNDMNYLYQGMDVFLFPSFFEGLGIVGVEAQASGTPVICTDTLPEEIDVSPLVYRVSLSDSAEKWADVIVETQNNKNIHKDMSSYLIKNNYDIFDLSKKLEKKYLEMFLSIK